MLIIVLALITTVILRDQLSLFWQRSTVLVVGAFLHSLPTLAAEMGMRSESPVPGLGYGTVQNCLYFYNAPHSYRLDHRNGVLYCFCHVNQSVTLFSLTIEDRSCDL